MVLAFNNVLEAGCLDTGVLIYIEELLHVSDIDSFGTTTARHKEGRFGQWAQMEVVPVVCE